MKKLQQRIRRKSPSRRPATKVIAEASLAAKYADESSQNGIKILDRLYKAVREDDLIAARALARDACIELGATAQIVSNLQEFLKAHSDASPTARRRV
jgi:hypothetical protein